MSFGRDFDNEMVECPYNTTHQMLRKRLQPHLIKCRLSYPDVELQKCPFNQTHLIPEPEFTIHVTNCSDRKLVTQYKYNDRIKKEDDEDRVKQQPVECDENWDDTEVEDYNPQKYLENANVLRKPEGIQPAQRKAFNKQERKRLGDDSDDECNNSKFRKENEQTDEDYSDGKELREKPKTPPPPHITNWHKHTDEHLSRRSNYFNYSKTHSRSNSNSRSCSRSRSHSRERRVSLSPKPLKNVDAQSSDEDSNDMVQTYFTCDYGKSVVTHSIRNYPRTRNNLRYTSRVDRNNSRVNYRNDNSYTPNTNTSTRGSSFNHLRASSRAHGAAHSNSYYSLAPDGYPAARGTYSNRMFNNRYSSSSSD